MHYISNFRQFTEHLCYEGDCDITITEGKGNIREKRVDWNIVIYQVQPEMVGVYRVCHGPINDSQWLPQQITIPRRARHMHITPKLTGKLRGQGGGARGSLIFLLSIYIGQKGLDIAFYSKFMKKAHFREQAATGVTSLTVAVPEGSRAELTLYAVVVYHRRYWCTMTQNEEKLQFNIIEKNLVFYFFSRTLNFKRLYSVANTSGVYQFSCRGEYQPTYDLMNNYYGNMNKSLKISFVSGLLKIPNSIQP